MEKLSIYNLIILDESGSMSCIKDQALSGLNETITSISSAIEEDPDQVHKVSLVAFNTEHQNYIFDLTDAKNCHTISSHDYQPDGGTPLYDAMGNAFSKLKKTIKPDENFRVLVTVITDGMENASREYSANAIAMIIDGLKKDNWIFTYIGANQDAVEEASKLNISNSMNWVESEIGTCNMLREERAARSNFYKRVRNESSENLNRHYFEEKDNADKKEKREEKKDHKRGNGLWF